MMVPRTPRRCAIREARPPHAAARGEPPMSMTTMCPSFIVASTCSSGLPTPPPKRYAAGSLDFGTSAAVSARPAVRPWPGRCACMPVTTPMTPISSSASETTAVGYCISADTGSRASVIAGVGEGRRSDRRRDAAHDLAAFADDLAIGERSRRDVAQAREAVVRARLAIVAGGVEVDLLGEMQERRRVRGNLHRRRDRAAVAVARARGEHDELRAARD